MGSYDGIIYDAKFAKIEGSGTAVTVVAAVTGKIIRVLYFSTQTLVKQTCHWTSNATAITGAMTDWNLLHYSPGFCPVGHFETAAGEDLKINAVVSTTFGGYVVYVLV